jgi:hypothetical protein
MADSTNSGPACCILGLSCCPPGGLTISGARKAQLAKALQKICATLNENDSFELAEGILADYDLVPAGVGAAIAQGYSRFIKRSFGTAV